MSDFFEPEELRYSRRRVDSSARRELELQALRQQAEQLRRSGAAVFLDEKRLRLHCDWNGKKNSNTSRAPRHDEPAETPYPPAKDLTMRTVRSERAQTAPQSPLERLLAEAAQLKRLGIKHAVDTESLTLKVGYRIYCFGEAQS